MNMKTYKIIFWVATSLIFLFEGVMPALTGHTELAKEGVRHIGFPDYFRVQLNVMKVLGALTLILPFMPARLKEWAYAGFTFTMISACVAHCVVDGLNFQSFFPLIVLAVLMVSYVSYHKAYVKKELISA
jgi:hypothetical protein